MLSRVLARQTVTEPRDLVLRLRLCTSFPDSPFLRIAEFERSRIVERVRAIPARGKAQRKQFGRQPYAIADAQLEAVADRSLRGAAHALGVSRWVVHRWQLSRKPLESGLETVTNCSEIPTVAA